MTRIKLVRDQRPCFPQWTAKSLVEIVAQLGNQPLTGLPNERVESYHGDIVCTGNKHYMFTDFGSNSIKREVQALTIGHCCDSVPAVCGVLYPQRVRLGLARS